MLERKMTQCKAVGFQDTVVGNAAKCKEHIAIFSAVRLKLSKKKTSTIVQFLFIRRILDGQALHHVSDSYPGLDPQPQQRLKQQFTRSIPCKWYARFVCTMHSRREADDQQAGFGVARRRDRSVPVVWIMLPQVLELALQARTKSA